MKYFPVIILLIVVTVITFSNFNKNNILKVQTDPLSIEYMKSQIYPGSDVKIEKTLKDGSNYKRYIVSFYSDNLKEYAYMTVPVAEKPSGGFPVIIFNHGYQIPRLYTPEGNYISYMDSLAREGYVIFKPDFRGNGKSEGSPGSSYFSPNYSIDVLNAIASVKKIDSINPGRIGIWGHSMGGSITLRVAEVSPDIKAISIWGGVVGSYSDIVNNWQSQVTYKPAKEDLYLRNLGLNELINKYGSLEDNPSFWDSIDPTKNASFINAPIQIHVGLNDNQVPPEFSKYLAKVLNSLNKIYEYYEYPGANHDINQGYSLAMQRTVDFFNRNL